MTHGSIFCVLVPALPTEASLPLPFVASRVVSSEAMEVDDTDLLGAPPQRPRGERSVCGRVMAFFGFY